ncbi:MAG TPA: cupin domain-containing protein, partial [Geminicoccaceae bacterium]|nr:cupin domain-containing protein [Geminicoccaceae bacterium]
AVETRAKRPLGDATGLTQFGVNLVELPPGCWSSQRHWHTHEDEFVYVVDGELTLVTDAGEQVLSAGMAAGFPAGTPDGHHLINRTDRPATYLEVGTRRDEVDECDYPDIDMAVRHRDGIQMFVRKNGEPYGPAPLPYQTSPRRTP